MRIVDDQGRQYRSKVEAALNGDDESSYFLEELLHERVDITDEIGRFRQQYTDKLSKPKATRSLPKSPPDGYVTERGWYNMLCFNSLDGALQRRLVYYGNVPLGHATDGRCHNPAEVEITTVHDAMPGPRFYCLPCAIEYLTALNAEVDQ